MKRTLSVLLALLSVLTCEAQKQHYSLDFIVSRTDFADTIAIEYERGLVFVPVSVGGKQLRFLLDSGASQTTIYDDVTIDGALPDGFIVSHDAVAQTTTVPMMLLPPLTLGKTTFSGMRATVRHRAVKRSGVDGIVGFDIVCKGLNLKIDVRNKQLVLSDRYDFFEQEPGMKLKYRLNFHVPYIEVCPFGKYRERTLFDTGFRQLYSINKASFDRGAAQPRHQADKQVEGRSMGRFAIGHGGAEQRSEVVFLCLDSLCVGGFSFSQLHTLTTQGVSKIGGKLLEYGAVTFNPQHKRMRFQPYDGLSRAVVANKQVEKAIVPQEGLPAIGLVWERSEAYKAGFREGDILLTADGQDIGSFDDYVRFRPLIGHSYRFLVRDRQGVLKEVTAPW